jgi:hypothetical protein
VGEEWRSWGSSLWRFLELDARWKYSCCKQKLQNGIWFANCVKVFYLTTLKLEIILRQL